MHSKNCLLVQLILWLLAGGGCTILLPNFHCECHLVFFAVLYSIHSYCVHPSGFSFPSASFFLPAALSSLAFYPGRVRLVLQHEFPSPRFQPKLILKQIPLHNSRTLGGHSSTHIVIIPPAPYWPILCWACSSKQEILQSVFIIGQPLSLFKNSLIY